MSGIVAYVLYRVIINVEVCVLRIQMYIVYFILYYVLADVNNLHQSFECLVYLSTLLAVFRVAMLQKERKR